MKKKRKRKTVSGATALAVLTATIPVHAMAMPVELNEETEGSNTDEIQLPSDLIPDDTWATFNNEDELSIAWNYTSSGDTIVLTGYKSENVNKKVVIPREIDGKTIKLQSLSVAVSGGITHVRVADGEDKVEVINRFTPAVGNGFYGSTILEYIDFSGLDVKVDSLLCFLQRTTNLKYADLSGWDVSNVMDFRQTVYFATNLKYLNLSGWNVNSNANTSDFAYGTRAVEYAIYKDMNISTYNKIKHGVQANGVLDVTNMTVDTTSLANTFKNVKASKIKGLETWDVSEVTNMGDMFDGVSNMTDFSAVEGWDTSSVTMMNGVFYRSGATNLDLSGWDTSNVTNMNGMFKDMPNLESVTFGEGWDMTNVTTANDIFRGNNKLHFLDLREWNIRENLNISNWFLVNSDIVDRRLLIVTDETRLQNNFGGSNRTTVNVTLSAGEGTFADGAETKTKGYNYLTVEQFDNAKQTIEADIATIEKPNKEGHTFVEWRLVDDTNSEFGGFDATYEAVYEHGINVVDLDLEIEGESLRVGNTLEITPVKVMSDGTRVEIPESEVLTLTSGDENVLSIEEFEIEGQTSDHYVFHADAKNVGTAELTLTYGDSTKTFTVDVFDYELENGNEVTLDLYDNKSTQLVVKGLYESGEQNLTSKTEFKVENESIATVVNGTLTALKEGTTTIKVTTEGEEWKEITLTVKDTTFDRDELYLSDIEYVRNQTSTGDGAVKINQNNAGGTISLIVNNTVKEFEKGIGAHATSTVVYDVSRYSEEFTRLMTYVGIDSSKGSNGNGAYFIMYTSQDGTTWTEVKRTDVFKGDSESILIDVELNGAKFIKLHANNNGNADYDHVVYGDLKLVKDGYPANPPATEPEQPEEGTQTQEFVNMVSLPSTVFREGHKAFSGTAYNQPQEFVEDSTKNVYKVRLGDQTSSDRKFILWTKKKIDSTSRQILSWHYTGNQYVLANNYATTGAKSWQLQDEQPNEHGYYVYHLQRHGADTAYGYRYAEYATFEYDKNEDGHNFIMFKDGQKPTLKEINKDTWFTINSMDDLALSWKYSLVSEDGEEIEGEVTTRNSSETVVLKEYLKGDEYGRVEIPREINGRKVVLESISGAVSNGVTHIRVAEGNGEKVELLNSDLSSVFDGNTDIEHIDFSGLKVEGLVSMANFAKGASNLKYLNLEGLDIGQVDNFSNMLNGAGKLEYLNLSGWNIDQGDTVTNMFSGVPALKNAIFKDMNSTTYMKVKRAVKDGGTLDVTNITVDTGTSLSTAFENVRASEIIGLDTWENTENITNMDYMFKNTRISDLEDVKEWNTSNVTSMKNMFEGAGLTNAEGIKNWDVSKVTSMNYMFSGANGLTKLDLSNWDTSKVTDFSWMFKNATSLKEVDISNLETTSASWINNMFNGCNSLNFINMSGFNSKSMETTNMFRSGSRSQLLVVTDDQRIKEYNFSGSNRTPYTATFNADGGVFADDSHTKTKERFYLTTEEYGLLEQTIENDVESIEKPTKEGYKFAGWELVSEHESTIGKLNATYNATWELEEVSDIEFEITEDLRVGDVFKLTPVAVVGDTKVNILKSENLTLEADNDSISIVEAEDGYYSFDIEGLEVGLTTLTLTYGEIVKTVPINVYDYKVENVENNTITLDLNELNHENSFELSVKGIFHNKELDLTNEIEYEIENQGIVQLDENVLTGLKVGNTDIKMIYNGKVLGVIKLNVLDTFPTNDKIYLSNLNYKSATVGWESIRIDRNVNNNGRIRLKVNGQVKEFEKGIGAHATSEVVYDVSEQVEQGYTRLNAYVGVDYSMGSGGNGVIFTISTSQNGEDWEVVERTGVLKGDSESKFIDIKLNGAKFIKLYADGNGDIGQDHASYGDLKLVKDGYTEYFPDAPNNEDVEDDMEVTAFFDKVKEVVTSEENTIQKFKDLLTNEGETDVDGTSNEVYEEAINEIKANIYEDGNKYATLDAIKALIQSIKDAISDGDEEEKPNAPSTDIEDIIIDLESYEFEAPGYLEFTPKLKLKDGSIVTIPYDSNSMPEITLTSSNKEVTATLDKDDDERNTTVWIGSSVASNAEITLEYKGITKKFDVSSYNYKIVNDEVINLDLYSNKSVEIKVNKVYADKTVDVKDSIELFVIEDEIVKSDGNTLTALKEGSAEVFVDAEGVTVGSLTVNVGPGNLSSNPNYDIDDEMFVDPEKLPSSPNYDVDDNMGVTPEEEKPNTPPVIGGGAGGGSTQPPTEEDKEEVKPQPPTEGDGSSENDKEEVKPETASGIENLKDLDKTLQDKVDSLIAESVVESQGLILNITGDKDDMSNISYAEVTKDGIFAVVDGQRLKFGTVVDGFDLDLNNARVVRRDLQSRALLTNYKPVAFKNTGNGLKITSNNLENILITSKVAEPFVDVEDIDWFKQDVEDAYNYGFTTGTTATTYDPYANITRAQFAVMIARALELTSSGSTNGLSDLEGKWYKDEVQALYEAGIIKGFNDGTFGGEKKLTRQQAATMIVNMLKHTGVNAEVTGDVQFADMDKIGEQAQDAVKYLASQDILVNGEEVKFNPYNNLTRAQMAKMLVRSLRLTDLY